MKEREWEGDVCYIRPDAMAGQLVEHHLASANYACVVIGAGVRLPPQSLKVFEAVVNAVHKAAPAAAIAFNTRPFVCTGEQQFAMVSLSSNTDAHLGSRFCLSSNGYLVGDYSRVVADLSGVRAWRFDA